jgi:lipoprotein-releasing system ATP-binding protein
VTTPLLAARGVVRTYRMGGTYLPVLRGVDFEVGEGEIVALVGASGAGKSTLLHLLGLLDLPTEGTIEVRGVDTAGFSAEERARRRNREIGFVFQFYHLIPELAALDNVCLGRWIGLGWGGWMRERRRVREEAQALLEQVGLGARLRHRPSQLSGGERQRVAIARALLGDPAVVLCDEPTGNLDSLTGEQILDLLLERNAQRGTAFVLATHNPEIARRCARTVRLADGLVVDSGSLPGPAEEILHESA